MWHVKLLKKHIYKDLDPVTFLLPTDVLCLGLKDYLVQGWSP